jgi:hypothetical protein
MVERILGETLDESTYLELMEFTTGPNMVAQEVLQANLVELQEQVATAHAETASVKAGMGVAVMQYRNRAERAERDLAKFYECVDSNGCYDDCARVHVHDTEELSFIYPDGSEPMRTVYHKVGE